jgi:hypothetical protein
MNEEQKNNPTKQGTARETLTNTMQGLAQPKPGLVFLFTLFLLNYKFWLVVFGEGAIAYKILTIGELYPIRLDFWYFYNDWAIWSKNFNDVGILLLKVVIAFVVSITYPAIINCTKWFYAKKISKIPTDVNEEYIREKQELKKKIKELEEASERNGERASNLNLHILELLKDIGDKKLLEISRNIQIDGESIFDDQNTTLNRLSFILFITLNQNKSETYYLSVLNLSVDWQDAFIKVRIKMTEVNDIMANFMNEVETIAHRNPLSQGEFVKFNQTLLNYDFHHKKHDNLSTAQYFKSLFAPNLYILGYFIVPAEGTKKLNIQGQLVLAYGLYTGMQAVSNKKEGEKQIILSLLPDLKKYGKTLEEIVINLFYPNHIANLIASGTILHHTYVDDLLGYTPQNTLIIDAQLRIAKFIYNNAEKLISKTEEEKQIILSLLPDLKEDGKTLEEILQNLFKEET